jgi:hypothetical protein
LFLVVVRVYFRSRPLLAKRNESSLPSDEECWGERWGKAGVE